MTLPASRASFHDPDGSVYLAGDKILRALTPQAAARIVDFLGSGLFQALHDRAAVPATKRLDAAELPAGLAGQAAADAVWFEHERLPFINYPHEWVPEQLAEACSFTLALAAELRSAGWDLKDGNARNVVFDGVHPRFVDFGSFDRRSDATPVWRPAGQLQRHFLLPLLAYRHLGLAPGSLLLGRADGLGHEEAYRCLRGARFDRHVFWLCTLPVWLGRRGGAAPKEAAVGGARHLGPEVCRRAADGTIRSLGRRTAALLRTLPVPSSGWSGYETARDHYRADELVRKRAAIEDMLRRSQPARVLDIGTNGGEYANLAAGLGARVVSIDNDVDALRVARRAAQQVGADVLHLWVDIASPTPALGWNGAECLSFDARCKGHFDLVLALAVLHHMLVSGRIPLDEAVAKLASYTRSHLLVEYVDPSDVMFASLARERASDFSGLDAPAFEQALSAHFRIEQRVEVVPGRRSLYLCVRHGV